MTEQQECRHCGRRIVNVDGRWIDPEATGDNSVWRETCDSHDTFDAVHEPMFKRGDRVVDVRDNAAATVLQDMYYDGEVPVSDLADGIGVVVEYDDEKGTAVSTGSAYFQKGGRTMTEGQAEHTPGPWYVTSSGDQWRINANGGIADICERLEDHGNARLIAAAPDLLDAARNLMQYASLIVSTKDEKDSIDLALESMQDAIEKAEGSDA